MFAAMTREAWLTFAICWIGGMACGAIASAGPTYLPDIMAWQQGVMPLSMAEFGSMLQSMFLFGWIVGGIGFGLWADLRDRLPVLGGVVLAATMFTAASVLVHDQYALIALRCAAGVFVGAAMVVSTTIGSEILPHTRRPLMMGILANSYAVGIVLSGALQSAAIPYTHAVLLFLVFNIPMLPAFSTRVGACIVADREVSRAGVMRKLGSMRREVAVGVTVYGCMLIVLWTSFTWLPTWLSQTFPGGDAGVAIRGAVMVALGMGAIVGSLLVAPLVHLTGRINSLIICYAGVIILSTFLYGVLPASSTHAIITVSALSIFFGMSQALMSFYVPELFPSAVRATAVGICFNLGRTVTAIAVLQVGFIAEALGGFQRTLLMATSMLVVGLLTALYARRSFGTVTPSAEQFTTS
ncbi:MAG: MFS transporter [Candidatus Kapabacteria bacterium]|nr:MFS transporter [Candidatus Kapabacteria bacterium]